MAELITVPTFVFNQGDVFSENGAERPVHIDYYNGSVCIRQYDGDEKNEIVLSPEFVKPLFKEIIKHLPEAEHCLKSK